jgi:hypothetical protein
MSADAALGTIRTPTVTTIISVARKRRVLRIFIHLPFG